MRRNLISLERLRRAGDWGGTGKRQVSFYLLRSTHGAQRDARAVVRQDAAKTWSPGRANVA